MSPEDEKRRWPRLKPSSVPLLKNISFNQGTDIQVIDISRGGILLETTARLRPQMKIELKLLTRDGLIKLEGSVLRSSVSSLQGVPKYRSAIEFDNQFHMLDDLSEPMQEASSEPQESDMAQALSHYGEQPLPELISSEFDENLGILTLAAPDMSSTSFLEMLKRNDW
jgi:hypothetical protein